MIIDIHTHAFADKIAERAIAALSECSKLTPCTNGTVSSLIERMEKSNVDISVVQPVATRASQVDVINNWIFEFISPKCLSFGAMHPEYADFEGKLTELKEKGIRGIKLHPDYQGFFVDDHDVFPLYEAAQELDMIILFHAGVDIGLPPPVHCTPDRLKKVTQAFPRLKIIAAHLGGCDMGNEVLEYLPDSGVWIDTSFSTRVDDGIYKKLVNSFGSERILFGSDCPWENPADTIDKLCSLDLSSSLMDRILYKNAQGLLKLNI